MDKANKVATRPTDERAKRPTIYGIGVAVLGIALIGGFVSGMQYEKGRPGSVTASQARFTGHLNGGSSGFGGRRINGSRGSVTAVNNSSITVNDVRTAATKTYTISSGTTITDAGATVSVSDIKVGDGVIVTASNAASTTATRIFVNPSFGGAQATPDSQPMSNTTTTST